MTGNPDLSDIAYDHRNLPVHRYLPDSTEQINGYNADGQRILKEVQTSSGTTWSFYIRDGQSTLGVIQDGELQYLNILAHGVSGRVIANGGSIAADNAKRYYLKDLIGSTRAVVDENGTTKENRDYYPFGLLMDERQYVQGSETTEKFSGKERDTKTGFDYFGARYYSSGLGRFLSIDPLADQFPSWSPYSYAFNNPLFFIDPTGMAPTCAEKANCDEIYEEGAIVENRLGKWKYEGSNQWQTVSLAEGVDEIKSRLGYAFHVLENTVGYEYHDFGGRTLAEQILNVTNSAGALEWIGGPRTAAAKGVGWLRSLFKTSRVTKVNVTAVTKFYPPNNGFLGTVERTFLMPGQQISRFGSNAGRFFSPSGTPLPMRALPPSANISVHNAFKVLKPFEVQAGRIAPAFGQIGLGTQYLSPVSASILLKRGIIAPVK